MTAIVRGCLRENRWVNEQAVYSPAPDLYGTPNHHYGSRFLFDRQGKLLFSIGDRGQKEAAQDLARPLGKVHRVNDDGTVPADRPRERASLGVRARADGRRRGQHPRARP